MSLRVAFLLTQDRGGPVDVTVRLAAELISGGQVEVRLFGPSPARDADLLGGRFTQVVVNEKSSIVALRSARATLRSWRPDIVHAQDRRSGLIAAALERTRSGPTAIVHTYHGVPDDVAQPWFADVRGAQGPSAYTRAVLTADAIVARTVTATIVPARTMGTFLMRRLHVPPRRIVHIDNPTALVVPRPPVGPVRRLLFVGLLIPRKGVSDLLQALARPETFPLDAELTIAGDGPERSRLEDLRSRLGLGERVRFLGFRQDIPKLLADADALVLPSRMEQQPLVLAEAMAAGKPVVATACGGVGDMLTGIPDVFVVEPGNVLALSSALKALFHLNDPGAIGRLLAERAADRFTAAGCAAAHVRLYERVTHAHPGSGLQRQIPGKDGS